MEKRFYTDEEYAKHKTRCLPVPKGEAVKYSVARVDPVYFMVNQLGITPHLWQAEFLDNLVRGKNTLACTSRQVGKTLAIAVFALWLCCFNPKEFQLPSNKKTKVIFVSKTDGQAKKVIADIRELIRLGDDRVYELTKGKVSKFFSEKVATGENSTNTKSEITFANGCQIISLPPTDAARGYSASQLFVDEIAFIPDDIITQVLEPITRVMRNMSCTSTPNGKQGWFYKNFDPDDLLKEKEFGRLWIPYDCIRHDDPGGAEHLDKKKQHSIRIGEERTFLQEYEADFTAAESSFFQDEDITDSIDDSITCLQEYKGECDMGIDFGKKVSRTVVSITTKERDKDGKATIRLVNQFEYAPEKGLGQDLVLDVEQLLKRYNVQRMIVEDCAASSFFQQAAVERGWPMTVFNPTADKNKQYYKFRAWLRQGLVRMPNISDLVQQMRGLVVVQLDVRERIEHGAGLRDDRVDSFMMATFHQIEERSKLRVIEW